MSHPRSPRTILTDTTGSATGLTYTPNATSTDSPGTTKFSATVAGTGAVTATVLIEFSNDNTNWGTLATITLSGTTSATDGYATIADWPYVRARSTAISGTGATITVIMAD